MRLSDAELAKRMGSAFAWRLPDGRVVAINRRTFGKAILCIGDEWTYEHGW